jgi:hypothetical protein
MIVRTLLTLLGFQTDESKVHSYDQALRNVINTTKIIAAATAAMGFAFLKAGSDAEETESKFNAVYSGIKDAAEETARNLADNFGLASTKAKQLLGDTGDLLTGFGFSQESALDLSNQVQMLAVDLASFTNYSGGAEGASMALTKALLGERESVKSLGISILEEDVKAQMLLNSQNGLTFETERQAKAYATLQLAQQQSVNAIGDFSRTQDGLANKVRIFQALLTDISVNIGKGLIPMAKDFIEKLQEWFKANQELIEQAIIKYLQGFIRVLAFIFVVVKKAIEIIIVLVKQFGSMSDGLNPIIDLFSALISFVWTAITTFTQLWSELGAGQSLLNNVGSGFDLLASAVKIITDTLENLKPLLEPIIRIGVFFFMLWQQIWTRLQVLISDFLKEMQPTIDQLTETFVAVFASILGAVEDLKPVFDGFINFALNGLGQLLKLLGDVLKITGVIIGTIADELASSNSPLKFLNETQLQQALSSGRITEEEYQAELGRRQRGEERQQILSDVFTAEPSWVPTPEMKNNQNNVNNEVKVEVQLPPGTTEEQAAIIKDTAEGTFSGVMNGLLRDTILNIQGAE